MSKWNQKRKRWLDRRARLGNMRKRRHNKLYGSTASKPSKPGASTTRTTTKDKKPLVIQRPPINFSLINNPEETMSFFMDFKNEIDRNQYGTNFFVDSKKVELVTVDALIYLIAILQNDKHNNNLNFSFAGNYPENETAKKVYTECGFTDYVHSNMKTLPKSTERVRIISGINNSPESARELCDFVIDKLGKSRKDTVPIQKVLVELMSNVYYHAYEKNSFMAKRWYMYAELSGGCVKCIFVDTGFGIAKTARKNFGEKFKAFFGMKIDDSKIIESVFNGDFRTATNLKYRGNGLLAVRDNVRYDIFKGFEVFSGRGRCIIPKDDDSNEVISHCHKHSLYGTLYQFILR